MGAADDDLRRLIALVAGAMGHVPPGPAAEGTGAGQPRSATADLDYRLTLEPFETWAARAWWAPRPPL